MRPAPILSPIESLFVRPLEDAVVDKVGHDPRSPYVEQFWLGILGPSTTWLLRHMAAMFDVSPDGFDLTLADTARRLGLGEKGGRHSPFVRSIGRCVQFGLAEVDLDAGTLAVRRRLPPLSRRQVLHLPELLQVAHQRWQEAELRTPQLERMRRRARQLALGYLATGSGFDEAERELHALGYHPALAHESVRWALTRHEAAMAAALNVG